MYFAFKACFVTENLGAKTSWKKKFMLDPDLVKSHIQNPDPGHFRSKPRFGSRTKDPQNRY